MKNKLIKDVVELENKIIELFYLWKHLLAMKKWLILFFPQ